MKEMASQTPWAVYRVLRLLSCTGDVHNIIHTCTIKYKQINMKPSQQVQLQKMMFSYPMWDAGFGNNNWSAWTVVQRYLKDSDLCFADLFLRFLFCHTFKDATAYTLIGVLWLWWPQQSPSMAPLNFPPLINNRNWKYLCGCALSATGCQYLSIYRPFSQSKWWWFWHVIAE